MKKIVAQLMGDSKVIANETCHRGKIDPKLIGSVDLERTAFELLLISKFEDID